MNMWYLSLFQVCLQQTLLMKSMMIMSTLMRLVDWTQVQTKRNILIHNNMLISEL